jgi:hypothetical protein
MHSHPRRYDYIDVHFAHEWYILFSTKAHLMLPHVNFYDYPYGTAKSTFIAFEKNAQFAQG